MPPVARTHFFDDVRQQREQKSKWKRARQAEDQYARHLRSVADQIGRIVKGLPPDDPAQLTALENLLRQYAEIIKPWAISVASKMIASVQQKDEAMWRQLSQDMGASLRQEVARAPTGQLLKDLLNENVVLITSLPIEAGQRVHKLAIENLFTGERYDSVMADIMRTGDVTKARATLIARTETARVASTLIEARATHIGCTHYIWRSSEDGDVRNIDGNPVGSHRLLNGRVIAFDSPPIASTNGMRFHAGQGPNCRCWPEPLLPDDLRPSRPTARPIAR